MKVQEKYYRLLKSGVKTIELRLYDEKRQKIKIGDDILFENLNDPSDTFIATVVHLHRANDFGDLADKIPPQKAGFQSHEDLVETMKMFYPPERQKEFGVLGIEIKMKK